MSPARYNLRATMARVAATRAAEELGIPAREARLASRARLASGRPSPRPQPRPQPRIRIVGAFAPENIARTLQQERLRYEAGHCRIIIQTRPEEHPDRPRVQVLRHAALPIPEPQGQQQQQQQQQQPPLRQGQEDLQPIEEWQARRQQQLYNIRQFSQQRLHSIHDNRSGRWVYHHQRDAQRSILSTWLGRRCVLLYDYSIGGTIWENPGMFAVIQRRAEITDRPILLSGRVGGRHLYDWDYRNRRFAWKSPDFA